MKNHFWLVCSIVWAGLIVYLRFLNPIIDDLKPWFEYQDKLGHVIFYALLSMLLIKTFSKEVSLQNPINIWTLTSHVFSLFIEMGQHFFTNGPFWGFNVFTGQWIWDTLNGSIDNKPSKVLSLQINCLKNGHKIS
jgi:hypothetical protein